MGASLDIDSAVIQKPLIGGKNVDGGKTVPIMSPWTGQPVASVDEATPAQAKEAIGNAVTAFQELRYLSAVKRSEGLHFISKEIDRLKEPLAKLIMEDVGKPLNLARGEVGRAVNVFRIAAEEAVRPEGINTNPDREAPGEGCVGRLGYVPAGPVVAITPFNFPLNLSAHKVAPALAAGCSVVLKPPPQGPRSVLLLGDIVRRSGLPENSLQVLPCDLEAAKVLTTSEAFGVLSFTGSDKVGWMLKQNAPARQRVLLELGGNAAFIVDESADIAAAAKAAAVGGYVYAGQVCISTQRIILHKSIAEEFTEAFKAAVAELPCGEDSANEGLMIGPLIDDKTADRVENWIEEAVKNGAQYVIKGERKSQRLMTPYALSNVKSSDAVCCNEVFGPVTVLETVDNFEDAITRANDSRFGLQIAVWTNDLKNTESAYRQLEVGAVLVNLATATRIDALPYGGVKDSGFGREGLRISIQEFSEPRLLMVKP